MIANLGVWGLITNLVFSLVWQFVDMSTWQSVIASNKKLNVDESRIALRLGGIATFIAPGIVGTFLGVFLVGTEGVTDSNVMMKVIDLLPAESPVMLFCVFVAILASIMSTIDGLLLAAAYTLVCDLVHSKETLEQLDEKREHAEGILILIRLFIGVIAVIGTLGVLVGLVQWLNISLFDLFYVVIVSQLALFGPVFVGLRSRASKQPQMVYAIVSGLVIGFGAFAASRITGQEWLMQGAGVFAMTISVVVALVLTQSQSEV
jgi:Na+/pantothenate symporter